MKLLPLVAIATPLLIAPVLAGGPWQDIAQLTGVWRNGKRRDLAADARFLYRAGEDDATLAPIHAKWGEGKIYVEAGREAFACAVDERGRVEFANGKPEQVRSRVTP